MTAARIFLTISAVALAAGPAMAQGCGFNTRHCSRIDGRMRVDFPPQAFPAPLPPPVIPPIEAGSLANRALPLAPMGPPIDHVRVRNGRGF